MAQYVCTASIQIWQELENPRWAINAMDELGLIYKEQGEREKAIETFNDALIQLEKISDHPGYEQLFKMLRTHLEEIKQDTKKPE